MMRKLLKKMMILTAIANTLSFCLARLHWFSMEKEMLGAEFDVINPVKDGEKMYYLVAGCVNQPRSAFDFLLEELDGGVTLVNYQPERGCNIKTIADQVIADAKTHNYQARVVGISIGDYVARRVEDAVPGAKSVGINPEPEPSILRPWSRIASKAGSVIVEALTVPLGWLSTIPWYDGCGNRFSTVFIADQFRDIGFVNDTPYAIDGTAGVIISDHPGKADGDEFLDNARIKQYFKGIPVATAKASHGDTVGSNEAYIEAWHALDLQDF